MVALKLIINFILGIFDTLSIKVVGEPLVATSKIKIA